MSRNFSKVIELTSANAKSKPSRIIVIDDNADDRAKIRRLLLQGSTHVYQFTEAETGKAGLRAALEKDCRPDCVFLDYSLPDMNASDILALLLDANDVAICPVVIVSGYAGMDGGRALLRAGAQDFIDKDTLTARGLTRTLETAVERWNMMCELRARWIALDQSRLENRLLEVGRESDARLRLALEASHRGIWTWDCDTGAVTWSPECYEVYRVTPGEFQGTYAAFLDLVHPDDLDRMQKTMRAAIVNRTVYQCEFRMTERGGVTVWVEHLGRATHSLLAASARSAAGKTETITPSIRMVGTVRDVTERREAHAELAATLQQTEEGIRLRDALAASVTHDLKNPLTALKMTIQREQRHPSDDPQQAEHALIRMAQQVRRLEALADAFLESSVLRAGKPLVLNLHDIDLVALTCSLVEEYQEVAPEHRIEVQTNAEVLIGTWDPQRLERVINNLLSNAVKYNPAGGSVLVQIEKLAKDNEPWALVRVKDEGMGIPAADQANIFKWFTRGKNAQQKTLGTGIGLAGSQQIVEQHGGHLTFESKEGEGSTFTLKLPRSV